MNLMLMGLIKGEIDNTCGMMGLPKNEKVSTALSKCIITCLLNPNRIDEAVEDLFNDLGLTEWRGKAMAEALLQVLRGLSTATDPINYLMTSFDNLTDLRNTLTEFEAQVSEDEEEDEEDDNDW